MGTSFGLPFFRSFVGALLVAGALAGTIATPAQAKSMFCSPSGDYCQQVYKRGGDTILEIRAFADYGFDEVCVAKQTMVCRSIRLRRSSDGIYISRVNWDKRFPNHGKGTYRVRWLIDGSRVGAVLTFRR